MAQAADISSLLFIIRYLLSRRGWSISTARIWSRWRHYTRKSNSLLHNLHRTHIPLPAGMAPKTRGSNICEAPQSYLGDSTGIPDGLASVSRYAMPSDGTQIVS